MKFFKTKELAKKEEPLKPAFTPMWIARDDGTKVKISKFAMATMAAKDNWHYCGVEVFRDDDGFRIRGARLGSETAREVQPEWNGYTFHCPELHDAIPTEGRYPALAAPNKVHFLPDSPAVLEQAAKLKALESEERLFLEQGGEAQ